MHISQRYSTRSESCALSANRNRNRKKDGENWDLRSGGGSLDSHLLWPTCQDARICNILGPNSRAGNSSQFQRIEPVLSRHQRKCLAIILLEEFLEMRFVSVAGLLLACSLWGQQAAPVPPHATEHQSTMPDDDDSQPLSPSASGVSPDAAVITIQGLCASPSASAGQNSPTMCQTHISRAQFEK